MTEARTTLGAGYAAVVLVIAAAGLMRPREEPLPDARFALEGWRPVPARLHEAWRADSALLQAHPPGNSAAEAVAAFEALGEAEAEAGSAARDPAYLQATERALTAMSRYWYTVGEDGYRALGVQLMGRFEHAIYEVIAHANAEKRPVKPWIRDNPQNQWVRELRKVGGTFVENAVGWGLITHDNRIAGDHPALLRLHFKLRWFRFVTEIKDYQQLMSKEELRAIWRWRIEGDRNLSMEQRIKVGAWLRQIEPDYPIYRVLGALAARRGQTDDAVAYYREALLDAPFDEQVAANLEFLLRTRAP